MKRTKTFKRRLVSAGVALGVAASLGVASVNTASAYTPPSKSCNTSYNTVHKTHRTWYEENGRLIWNVSNYNDWGSTSYRMLASDTIQVWSGGRYYVVDGYRDRVASTGWTIRSTDYVYQWVNGKWVFIRKVSCEIRK